jgi:competence protein ComEC
MAKKYPALFTLVAVIGGILLADSVDLASYFFLLASLILIFPAIVLYYKRRIMAAGVVILLALSMLIGFGYSFRFKTFPPGHIIHFTDDDIKYTIYGTIDDWPTLREHRTDLIVAVDSIGYADEIKGGCGRLMLHIGNETTALQYKDRIIFESQLYSIKGGKNPSGYDFRRYMNLKKVFANAYLPLEYNIRIDPPGRLSFYRLVDKIRNYIIATFKRTLDENSAALASGFLIGDTRDIRPEVYKYFRDSGTLHLLAVSGSNVALVILFFSFFLKFSPMKIGGRTLLLLIIIILFSNLAFNQPSVVRASVMAALVLLGKYFQRRIDLNNIIAATALIILIFQPTELFDVGFQLSFVTAWGLIFFAPKILNLSSHLRPNLLFKIIIFPLIICAVAQLMSLPMSAFYFQRMPMISFLSNLIIVPLVSIIVVGEVIVIFASLLLPLLGDFCGSLLNPIIRLTLDAISLFGSDRYNVLLNYRVTALPLLLYYIMLLIFSSAINSRKARRLSVLYLLLLLNSFLIGSLFKKNEETRVMVFSIPSGMASIIYPQHPQVILSNLPEKDYLYGEIMIEPYLANYRIKRPDIISLSANYQNLREAFYFQSKKNVGQIYLPRSSRNSFLDMTINEKTEIDSKINFYKSQLPANGIEGNDIYLSDGLMVRIFEKSALLFISRQIAPAELDNLIYLTNLDLTIVKPQLFENDTVLFNLLAGYQIKDIICSRNELSKSYSISTENGSENIRPTIHETAQLGAVELVVKNGDLIVRK